MTIHEKAIIFSGIGFGGNHIENHHLSFSTLYRVNGGHSGKIVKR